jgi:hypothetical protein
MLREGTCVMHALIRWLLGTLYREREPRSSLFTGTITFKRLPRTYHEVDDN